MQAFCAACEQVQRNLSFSQKCLEETLLEIGRQQQSQWRMDDSEIADFARRVALRVRCMCHHFAKADARATPARWI